MEIVILGSGGFVPSIRRNAPGYLFKINGKNLVFDFGAGSLQTLLKCNVDYNAIDYIFLTHNHVDHIADLIPFFHVCKVYRKAKLNIIGFKGVEKFIKNIFKAIPSTEPKINIIDYTEMGNSEIDIDVAKIKSRAVKHSKNCIGFRVEAEGKVVVYSGDSDVCRNLEVLSQDADVFICDCALPDELKYKGHLIPSEAGRIAEKSNVKKLVLTHLSPICAKYDIVSQAKKFFGGEVVVAEDLMRIGV